ncbi:MAG TPA: hypothetical protein VJK52_01625 [Candidatus Nanoarchaeia archaeon]|nr:hypothetical protein [Candidatus Nanoarchaeia archaeon]
MAKYKVTRVTGKRGTAAPVDHIGPEREFLSDVLFFAPGDFGEFSDGHMIKKYPRETSAGYRKK